MKSSRTSNGIVERLLGKMASLIRRIKDLVVEHREIQSQTKADRVSGRKIRGGNVGSGLVCLQ